MITIQVLISFTELNVENAIKRMFLIANSMQKDSKTRLKEIRVDSKTTMRDLEVEEDLVPQKI